MKSYTDLEQTKKLAEILPLESADMVLPFRHTKNDEYIPGYVVSRNYIEVYNEMMKLPGMEKKNVCQLIQPAWSLAALLGVINKTYYVTLLHDGIMWNILVIHHDIDKCNHTIHADSPVDACVAMIELLHELKIL